MTTKTEDRMKTVIKEFYEEKQTELVNKISDNIYTIFLWGFACGIVVSYTNVLSLCVGGMVGWVLAKKELPIIDILVIKNTLLSRAKYLKQNFFNSDNTPAK